RKQSTCFQAFVGARFTEGVLSLLGSSWCTINKNETKNNFRSIKVPLKRVLKDTSILPKLEQILKDMNLLYIHTTFFLKMYLLDKYEKGEKVEITETFIEKVFKTNGIMKDFNNEKGETRKLKEEFFENEYFDHTKYGKINLTNKSRLIHYM